LQKADGQLKSIDESIAFTNSQVQDETHRLYDLNQQLQQYQDYVNQTKAVLDEKRRTLDSLRSEYQQVQRSQFDAEKNVAVADTSIQNLQRTISQLEDERRQREDQRQRLDQERILHEKELAIKKVDLEQLQRHQEYTKDQILQTQSLLDSLRNELAVENRKLDSKKNEHDLLKSMIDSMEGYPDSVKFLHNNHNWHHESPILSDVLYVKEEFRTALENVLEPYLSYYLVNNLHEGLQAVHLLDDNKKGKANFFLLDTFNRDGVVDVDFQHSAGTHQPEGVIPALSVVDVEEKYKKLAEYLLGNVFIADNEDVLQNSNGFVVIEKNGKYVKGKYSLTGGSVGLIEGKKIGRAKNLEKLQEEIVAQETVVEGLRATIQERHNEVIAFNEDLRESALRETEREIQQFTNQVFSLHNKLENLHSLQVNSQHRLEELGNQMQQTQQSVEEGRRRLAEFNQQLQVISSRLSEADEGYKQAEAVYGEASNQYNEFNLNVTRQQSKINALRQELEFKNNQLKDLKDQIESNTLQLSETVENIDQSKQSLQGNRGRFAGTNAQKDVEEKALNEADQAYYNLRQPAQRKRK
jgi:chromosome segregation protein